jgi:acetyl-CoA synthetase
VITADEQARGGKHLPLKAIVDEALAWAAARGSATSIVYKRTGGTSRRTRRATSGCTSSSAKQADTCEPEWVGAEHPLFILYTSGSTGKPKGVQHSSAAICCGRSSR